jgi:hypothetical protein
VLVFVYGGPHAQMVNYACRLHSQRSAAQRPNLATASTLSATAASAASTAGCRCCAAWHDRSPTVPHGALRCNALFPGCSWRDSYLFLQFLLQASTSHRLAPLVLVGTVSTRTFPLQAGYLVFTVDGRGYVCAMSAKPCLPIVESLSWDRCPVAHGCMY